METLRRIVQRLRRFTKKDYHELERRQNELNYDELERRQRKAGLRQFLASRSYLRPGKLLQPQRQAVIQRSVNNNLQKTVARVEPIVEPPRISNNLYPAKVDNNDSTRTVKLNILYPDLSGLK